MAADKMLLGFKHAACTFTTFACMALSLKEEYSKSVQEKEGYRVHVGNWSYRCGTNGMFNWPSINHWGGGGGWEVAGGRGNTTETTCMEGLFKLPPSWSCSSTQ